MFGLRGKLLIRHTPILAAVSLGHESYYAYYHSFSKPSLYINRSLSPDRTDCLALKMKVLQSVLLLAAAASAEDAAAETPDDSFAALDIGEYFHLIFPHFLHLVLQIHQDAFHYSKLQLKIT